jgi:hypothetical protein
LDEDPLMVPAEVFYKGKNGTEWEFVSKETLACNLLGLNLKLSSNWILMSMDIFTRKLITNVFTVSKIKFKKQLQ